MGRTQAGRPAAEFIEQARHFDFWLGEWDVTWGGDGSATSSVYLDFDGRVLIESWDGRPGSSLQGMSVSIFDEEAGVWRNTWVDNQGRYAGFVGGFDGDGMDLRSETGDSLRRARWLDIAPDSFSWTLELSDDAGRTWRLVRDLSYRRVL